MEATPQVEQKRCVTQQDCYVGHVLCPPYGLLAEEFAPPLIFCVIVVNHWARKINALWWIC